MAEQVYTAERPLAGNLVTKKLLCQIDTYYVGMPLDYDTSPDDYKYSATVIKAIAYENITLAAQGYVLCLVSGSEFPSADIVDDSDDALTVTADMEESARSNGIILR